MAQPWPASLQQKLNSSGFEMIPGNPTIRSDMDTGPAKVRSRYTDAIDVYRASILLDFSEHDDFMTFYKTSLNNGVNTFEFTDPFTEQTAIFRFIESPTITALGGRTFRVNMIWEKIP